MDRLELYRWATQDPETQVAVMAIIFGRLRPRSRPGVLREDFAGTAADAVAWVAAGATRRAIAVDRDAATIAWARRRAARILGRSVRRIQFITADVSKVAPPAVPAADIISVLNFSVCYFHRRAELGRYFRHARSCLRPDGLLILNLFGGPGARCALVEKHQITPRPRLTGESALPPFEYQWEQRSWHPATRRLDCRIHFVVPPVGRSAPPRTIRNAFRYDWRLWTVSELTTLLRHAGFAEVQLWRHTADPARGTSGIFLGPVASIPRLAPWIAYLVAIR